MSLERLARKSPLRKRLHQFGAIEQLHQLGDRFLRRRMFSGDVARDDRLRLEDRIRSHRDKGDKPCSFRKAKAEIPPAGRAGRATGQRTCCKSCWRTMARHLRARRSISPKAAIWRRFACAWTG